MKKTLSLILTLLMAFSLCVVGVSAADDPLSYLKSVYNESECLVDDCDENAEGVITVPETYEGMTVYAIYAPGFSYCRKITGIVIPKTVTKIDTDSGENSVTPFRSTTALEFFSVDEENPAFCSVDGVLYTKDMKTLVAYPSAKAGDTFAVPEGVEIIDNYAFCGSKLKKITLPDSVKTIGEGAFSETTELEEVNLPEGLTSIPWYCFAFTTSLKTVDIPDTVTVISGDAFAGAFALKEITLPEGLEVIGDMAFAMCPLLEKVNIPDSVKEIYNSSFVYSYALNDIEYSFDTIDTFAEAFMMFGFQRPADYDEAEVLALFKEGIDIIGSDVDTANEMIYAAFALAGCDITGATAPVIDYTKTTVRINYSADLKAAFETAYPGINVVCINHANTEIRNSADATYDSAGYTGDTYCTDCGTLIESGKEIPQLERVCGDNLTWSLDSDGTLTISGNGAMYDYTNGTAPWYESKEEITSIIVEEGVTSIGNYAFGSLYNVVDVSLPESLESVGNFAFYICPAIEEITLSENVSKIGSYAFYNCSHLEKINIPDAVTRLEEYTFSGCFNLVDLTLSKNITSLGGGAFAYCYSLPSIEIPAGVQYVTWDAYKHCRAIEHLTVPTGVVSIERNAFQMCYNLKTVILPATLTNIATGAFDGNDDITDIYFIGTQEQWDSITISQYSNDPIFNAKLHFVTVLEAKVPTCGTTGLTEGLYCSECDENVVEQEIIPATGDHTGGEANCSSGAICDVCQLAYGEVNADNHTNTEIRGAVEATYDNAGYTGDIYCADCGTLIEEGVAIPQLERPDTPDDDTDGVRTIFDYILDLIKAVIEFITEAFKI